MRNRIIAEARKFPEGWTSGQINAELKTTKQNLHKHLQKMLEEGLIVVKSPGYPIFYLLTQKAEVNHFSDGIRGGRRRLNLHKSEILLPVLGGNIRALRRCSSNGIGKWLRFVYPDRTDLPMISSLKINGKSSISFYLTRQSLLSESGPEFERSLFTVKHEVVGLVKAWLWEKFKIRTGWPIECQQEIEVSAGEFGARVDRHKTVKRTYDVPARGVFGNIRAGGKDVEAAAWIDRSQWDNPTRMLNVESNSRDYASLLLDMPLDLQRLIRDVSADREEVRDLIESVALLMGQVRALQSLSVSGGVSHES